MLPRVAKKALAVDPARSTSFGGALRALPPQSTHYVWWQARQWPFRRVLIQRLSEVAVLEALQQKLRLVIPVSAELLLPGEGQAGEALCPELPTDLHAARRREECDLHPPHDAGELHIQTAGRATAACAGQGGPSTTPARSPITIPVDAQPTNSQRHQPPQSSATSS